MHPIEKAISGNCHIITLDVGHASCLNFYNMHYYYYYYTDRQVWEIKPYGDFTAAFDPQIASSPELVT